MVKMNCDETAIPQSFEGVAGFLTRRTGLRRDKVVAQGNKDRGTFGYLAFLVDDAEIQKVCPQVIIGNAALLKKSVLDELSATLPPNVYLVRQKSSWMSQVLFCCCLGWVAKAARPLLKGRTIVLLLDVSKVHVHPKVLATAARVGIKLVWVPAKMTFLVQPCDTHAFRRLKACLRRPGSDLTKHTHNSLLKKKKVITLLVDTHTVLLKHVFC